MQLTPVPTEIAHAGLRALKTVCLSSPNSTLTEIQTQFLFAVQKCILHTDFALDTLEAITPSELATIVEAQEFKDRIIRACIIAACIDGTVETPEVSQIDQFAEALNVDMKPVQTAWKLAKQNLTLARIDIIRKSLAGVKIKQLFNDEGLLATVKQFFPLAGIELPELTAKYKNVFDFSAGTLGKEFTNYLERNQFPLPGQKGAGPEPMVVHDCLHILGDYGTTAPEEIEVGSFQAGCQSNDPIYGLLFIIAQYHLDVQVAPVASSQKMQADPEKMMAAFARGCRVKKDMWVDFKPWDYFERPVEDLRVEFGIEPK